MQRTGCLLSIAIILGLATSASAVPPVGEEHIYKKVDGRELMIFDRMPHGFFNYGKYDNKPYYETVLAADRFLAKLGWLQGEPTLPKPE
ncbi:MAG: hypothetical protein GXX96_22510 [Planctomycetaceae bacterium]|nr:hypothetical protein [Planctomycetaceae bacterium]